MPEDPIIEFYGDIGNHVWLRVVLWGDTRHVFITCDLTEKPELETALRVMAEKVREGYDFQAVIPTPDDTHELWLTMSAQAD